MDTNENGLITWKTPSQYHNESVDAASMSDDRSEPFSIVSEGLSLYPYDIDLLADAVLYGPVGKPKQWVDEGDLQALSEGSAKDILSGKPKLLYSEDFCLALMTRKKYWNWRAFVYVIDYLKERRVTIIGDLEKVRQSFDLAVKLAREFVERFPEDDRAYNELAEALIESGRRVEAEKTLREAIFKKGLPETALAQSCLTFMDMLMERGAYDEALVVARKGQVATAQAQPSTSVGYFIFCEALIRDAQFTEKHIDEPSIQEGNEEEEIEKILSLYETAGELLQGKDAYLRTINWRTSLLKGRFGVSSGSNLDEELVERVLEIALSKLYRKNTESVQIDD